MLFNGLISIIIPVYNCEKKIIELLASLQSQTYKYFEVLIINDGSSDNTQKLCEMYGINDSRFKVFNRKKEGVSSARNYGLDNAIGEYVIFIDADDNIANTYLEKLIFSKDEGNLIIGTTVSMLSNGKVNSIDKVIQNDSINILLNHWSVWGKLFRRVDIKNIRFDEKVSVAEDLKFICDYLCEINPMVFWSQEAEYIYTSNENSTMRSGYHHGFLKGFETEIECYIKLGKKGFSVKNTPIIANGAYQVFTRFLMLPITDQHRLKDDYVIAKKWCLKYKEIIKESNINYKKKIIIYLSIRFPIIVVIYKMLKKWKGRWVNMGFDQFL